MNEKAKVMAGDTIIITVPGFLVNDMGIDISKPPKTLR